MKSKSLIITILFLLFLLNSCFLFESPPTLDTPGNLTASDGLLLEVNVFWSPVDGASVYFIQRSPNPAFPEFSYYQWTFSDGSTNFTDDTLAYNDDSIYYYRVVAQNPATSEHSSWSEPESGYQSILTIDDYAEIPFDTWMDYEITNSHEVQFVYFNATNGVNYVISWQDAYQGEFPLPSADIQVSALREDQTTYYFNNVDHGYNFPQVITAAATEKVLIRVQGYAGVDTGTYKLFVTNQ